MEVQVSFKLLTRQEQYKAVYNAAQKKKLLNRRLIKVLAEMRDLVELTASFDDFKGEDRGTKLDPQELQTSTAEYYQRLRGSLYQIGDPQIQQWLDSNEATF